MGMDSSEQHMMMDETKKSPSMTNLSDEDSSRKAGGKVKSMLDIRRRLSLKSNVSTVSSSSQSSYSAYGRSKRAPRSINDLTFQHVLGSGTFGKVHKAINKHTGEPLAVKEITAKSLQSKLAFLKEVKILRVVKDQYLLRFVSVFVEGEESDSEVGASAAASQMEYKLYLVTEYCAGGSLQDLLLDGGVKLPWITRVRFAWEIASGLAALHANGLIHRDLKSENCLLRYEEDTEPDRLMSQYTVVLADFGLSRWYIQDGGKKTKSRPKMTIRGTAWSMAPELMDYKNTNGYTIECDIFSFGVVLLEIATRARAIDIPRNEHDLSVDWDYVQTMSTNTSSPKRKDKNGVTKVRRDSLRDCCPPGYLEIARNCVNANPQKRPNIQAIVESFEDLLTIMAPL